MAIHVFIKVSFKLTGTPGEITFLFFQNFISILQKYFEKSKINLFKANAAILSLLYLAEIFQTGSPNLQDLWSRDRTDIHIFKVTTPV